MNTPVKASDPLDPTNQADAEAVEEGTALSLSGGGYRAMLFHVGSLWRLYECGVLKDVKRISSVSGGSITAARLGQVWKQLSFDRSRIAADFVPLFVQPIRRLGSKTIDAQSILGGLLLPGTIGDRVASKYDELLFKGATLQDLPSGPGAPRFVINATNIQSAVLWRFSSEYMGDYRVGRVMKPKVRLSEAVAASSAFPPVLSPKVLKLNPSDFISDPGNDLADAKFRKKVVLSDGGVYDNLGIETTWKRYSRVLVSDAGGKVSAEEDPHTDWPRHSYRVLNVIDNQVRSLRKRQMMAAFESGKKEGVYWGIRTDIKRYSERMGGRARLDCPFDKTTALANIDTRLKSLDDVSQEKLINWGYAVADSALATIGCGHDIAPAFPYARGV